MPELKPPFVVSEGRDLMAFDRLDDVESHIEAYDVRKGTLEFFDANGQRLEATVDGYRVHVHLDRELKPEPERLEAMLRRYFAGMGARRTRFASYASEAEHASSLQELLELRLKLSNEPRFPLWARFCQRLGIRNDP